MSSAGIGKAVFSYKHSKTWNVPRISRLVRARRVAVGLIGGGLLLLLWAVAGPVHAGENAELTKLFPRPPAPEFTLAYRAIGARVWDDPIILDPILALNTPQ